MKASWTPTREQVERVSQEVNDLAMKCIADNTALLLIAIARTFGFREKRLNILINGFNQVRDEYENYSDDGVFDIKINAELQAIGIDPKTLYSQNTDIKRQIQSSKKRKESKQLTLKEQYEMKKIFDEMRKCL